MNSAGGIPKQFLDDIRHRLRLSEVIGKRIKVTRAGREYKACCPFHKEKTPSFTINDDKHFYHCFGCGAHGDHIGFVMRHDNVPFMDALEGLASEAGLQVPKPSPKAIEKQRKKKELQSIMEDACQYFETQLHQPENAEVLRYLLDRRGLSPETISGFRLGYAPDDSQALRKYLKQKGWSDQDMIETALMRPAKKDARQGSQSAEPYAFFRDRVMFPVLDRFGQVVAYGGRILPEDIRPLNPNSGFVPPKYMNSTDTPLFHKGSMLYNESHARQAVADKQSLIVVEGYADVIALAQAGFKGAVAPLGTALTESQIELLWRMIPNDDYATAPSLNDNEGEAALQRENVPYLCFDGDNAGQRAAMRAAERLLPMLQPGKSARFVFMPKGMDPDDLVKQKGPKAMDAELDRAISLFDMIWMMHVKGRRLDTPESKAAVEKKLYNTVATIADGTVQGYYKSLLKNKIWQELKGGGSFNKRSNNAPFASAKNGANGNALPSLALSSPRNNVQILREKIILAALINHPFLYDDIAEQVGIMNFSLPEMKQLKDTVFNVLNEHEITKADDLKEHLNKAGVSCELLNESVYIHASFVRPDTDNLTVREGVMDILERAKSA